jgi:hypothetical protein
LDIFIQFRVIKKLHGDDVAAPDPLRLGLDRSRRGRLDLWKPHPLNFLTSLAAATGGHE